MCKLPIVQIVCDALIHESSDSFLTFPHCGKCQNWRESAVRCLQQKPMQKNVAQLMHNNNNQMLACDDIMPTGWTPAAASSTLEEWTRTFSRGQQCSCFRITVFYGVRAGQQKVCEWGPKIWKIQSLLTHLVVYGGQGKNKYYLL